MSPQLERQRGDQWADMERQRGAWVQKLPASTLAGIPDWLHVHKDTGISLLEAKTLEAVLLDGGGIPVQACSAAQRFTLRMIHNREGRARVLILSPEGFLDLDWLSAQQPLTASDRWRRYQ